MTAPPSGNPGISLNLIEAGITLLAVGWALAFPRLGARVFQRVERALQPLARRRGLAVLTVGLAASLLRLAILPFCPIPSPFVPNDFSFLLAADTFAHGRLTNPTPALWTHFESIHITMVPSYMSMYFPSQGLLLAAGQVLFGHPWFGLVLGSGLMCAGLCWMLQAWLPPTWALLGGVLAIVRLGLFSYWINTYSGAGLVSALGGALVLGALPRITGAGKLRQWDSLLLAAGIVLLATTRPYEGLLLCLPVAAALGLWMWRGKHRPRPLTLLRQAALPLALLMGAAAWMGYYDDRAFGSPTTLPYTVDRATYAVAPYYIWQSQRPDPGYRHESLRRFYYDNELADFKAIQTPSGFLFKSLTKLLLSLLFYAGFALVPPLFTMRHVFRDKRMRLLWICLLVLCIGMLIQIYFVPHYLAPFTAAFYAIGLQGMRHLRQWQSAGQPVGLALTRLCVAICLLLACLRLFPKALHLRQVALPSGEWIAEWYGPGVFGQERVTIESKLRQMSGGHLVLVRYSGQHNPLEEWVYNAADIDASKVIWAREMTPSQDAELIEHYKNRQVWLVEPDSSPITIVPYSIAVGSDSATAVAP